MTKKIILCTVMICLMLFASIAALGAGEDTGTALTQESRQMPRDDMPQGGQIPGGRGGMRGARPMPDGEMPQMPDGEMPQMPEGEVPQGQFGGGFNGEENAIPTQDVGITKNTSFLKEYFTPILSVVLLAFAFIFVIFYKRKTY